MIYHNQKGILEIKKKHIETAKLKAMPDTRNKKNI